MAAEDRFESITKEHREQWGSFTKMLQWSTALCIITVVLLAIFVA